MQRRIGTAGWAIPRDVADQFPTDGTGLQRYASVFDGAEINSTFRHSHRASTYARWAASTPEDFRFAVKAPEAITHGARLRDCEDRIDAFLEEIAGLGSKLGPLLVQLPPSLPFEPEAMEPSLARLGREGATPLALEPRHQSWFTDEANAWLEERRIARVAADPARHPGAERPGGWRGLAYFRLHGAPRVYYSSYEADALAALAAALASGPQDTWCVFDNTASGAAAANALSLRRLLLPG